MLITCLILIGKWDGPFYAAVPALPPHTYIIVLRNSKQNFNTWKEAKNQFQAYVAWRAGTTTYYYSVPSPRDCSKNPAYSKQNFNSWKDFKMFIILKQGQTKSNKKVQDVLYLI
jgi:hypothetical protein